jgi:tetratricopeptide (TPR) repeat protein
MTTSTASPVAVEEAKDGLHNWIDSIVEKGVKNGTHKSEGNILFPPVRNGTGRSQHLKTIKPSIQHEKILPVHVPEKFERISKERLSNRDYFREWDKFDVDKAEKEIDSDDGDDHNSAKPVLVRERAREEVKLDSKDHISSDPAVELKAKLNLDLLSETERKFMARREKQMGNEFFRNHEYETAIACYSKSIALDNNNAVTYANRALAYKQVSKLCQAMADINQAVAIDPGDTKNLARRGTIHHKCGRFLEAVEDFATCIRKEPGNKEYEKLWNQSKSKLGEEKHNTSKKKISIVEDDGGSEEEDDDDSARGDENITLSPTKEGDHVDSESVEEVFTPGALTACT